MRNSHLRASYLWQGEVMADVVLREAKPISCGNAPDVTFVSPMFSERQTVFDFDGAYTLVATPAMGGVVHVGGKRVDLAQARGAQSTLSILPGDWGVITLDKQGHHEIFFQFVDNAPLPRRHIRDVALMIPGMFFSLLFHAAILVKVFDGEPDGSAFLFPGKRELVAGYLVSRPMPPPPPAAAAPQSGNPEEKEKAPPSSTKGEKGKSGGEGEKERLRAPDPDKGNPDEALAAPDVGLNSAQSRQTIEKAMNRGGFDERLGKALARIQGPSSGQSLAGFGKGTGTGVGAGVGTGTLTKSTGKGAGGGGKAIGDVVTQNAIETGGTRVGRGVPGGTGTAETMVQVDIGEPGGELGGLSAAEILKVVNARRNGLRACYERELQRSRNLGGKVVIFWKIDSSGKVIEARTSKTTMNNAKVEDCLVRQVLSMRFPSPPNGATAKVNFPFVFSPR